MTPNTCNEVDLGNNAVLCIWYKQIHTAVLLVIVP